MVTKMSAPGTDEQLRLGAATRTVRIRREQGLHLRVCSAIVTAAAKHRAKVRVQYGSQSANAESIFELLMLAASQGTELMLSGRGPDAKEAVEAVAEVLEDDPCQDNLSLTDREGRGYSQSRITASSRS